MRHTIAVGSIASLLKKLYDIQGGSFESSETGAFHVEQPRRIPDRALIFKQRKQVDCKSVESEH